MAAGDASAADGAAVTHQAVAGSADQDLAADADEEAIRPPYQAPETDDEILVARIWAQLLGVEPVGRRDSFFRLGGDSILAIRATARLSAQLGRGVGLSVMFESGDLVEVAAALTALADR
jgi:hypothetical protein